MQNNNRPGQIGVCSLKHYEELIVYKCVRVK